MTHHQIKYIQGWNPAPLSIVGNRAFFEVRPDLKVSVESPGHNSPNDVIIGVGGTKVRTNIWALLKALQDTCPDIAPNHGRMHGPNCGCHYCT